ncbi:MAG: class I SAM-dependent methyltransferase [Alphaproteobacteria bacterium]|nr:class I SAM-dependent methyltransferase [Alphaproteobacteria bacterium]
MTGPNAQQVAFWNGEEGVKWVASNERLDAMLQPIGDQIAERAAVRSGDRVLDIGCGGGATLVALAPRVAPDGSVTGVDISAPLLTLARERTRRMGMPIDFLQADAETHPLGEEHFDLALSRFGVMFFANPAVAFSNIRRALKRSGRLVFVCWQALGRNPWMTVPRDIVQRYAALPPRSDPHTPGPFAFADPMRVRNILAAAGFGSFQIEGFAHRLMVGGGSIEGAVMGTSRDGPMASLLKDLTTDARQRLEDELRTAYRSFVDPDGIVRLPASIWLVTAQPTG